MAMKSALRNRTTVVAKASANTKVIKATGEFPAYLPMLSDACSLHAWRAWSCLDDRRPTGAGPQCVEGSQPSAPLASKQPLVSSRGANPQ